MYLGYSQEQISSCVGFAGHNYFAGKYNLIGGFA